MDALIPLVDVLAAIAFAVAAAAAIRRGQGQSAEARIASFAFAAAMAIYVFVSISNALEHGGVTAMFTPWEDYVEVLFAPMLIFAATSRQAARHVEEQTRSARLLSAQNELLLEVLETSPVGIMIVAPGGVVTFANEPARNLLGIAEDSDTGRLVVAPWRMADARGRDMTLADLVRDQPVAGERVVMRWPSGQRTQAMVRARPMADSDGSLGGAVVTIETVR